MADSNAALSKLVPGFDFLQGLVKNTSAVLPHMGQWIAPTLNPEELEKRIDELRTVQFWLEQNARLLGATIQALEVQRMTLSTLKSMNVSMGGLRDSLSLKSPARGADSAPPPKPTVRRKAGAQAEPGRAAPPAVVDPMQWWGALTKQFTTLAANAMKDSASEGARNLAGAIVKQGVDAAGQTMKQAVAMPGRVARKAVSVARSATQPSGAVTAARKRGARKR